LPTTGGRLGVSGGFHYTFCGARQFQVCTTGVAGFLPPLRQTACWLKPILFVSIVPIAFFLCFCFFSKASEEIFFANKLILFAHKIVLFAHRMILLAHKTVLFANGMILLVHKTVLFANRMFLFAHKFILFANRMILFVKKISTLYYIKNTQTMNNLFYAKVVIIFEIKVVSVSYFSRQLTLLYFPLYLRR